MATPPDDPLANSDRTVGVLSNVWGQGSLKSLKREALLFDQIAVPDIDLEVDSVWLDELLWLRDIGIVRAIPPLNIRDDDDPTVYRQYLDVLAAETGEPIDVQLMPMSGSALY